MFYAESLRQHRIRARKLARDCWDAYNKLQHKESNYAKEIKALAMLHDEALAVYEEAPDCLRLRK